MTTHRTDTHPEDQLFMGRPLTVDQIRTAANALGFAINVQADTEADGAPPSGQARQTSLLLATLETLVVRWQLDQDWRDPVSEQCRHAIARAAQADATELDTLAAGLRRVQTLTGLLTALDSSGAGMPSGACPPQLLRALLTAVGLLLSSSVAAYVSAQVDSDIVGSDSDADERVGEPAGTETDDVLTGETGRLLAAQAVNVVEGTAAALHDWVHAAQRGQR